MNPNQESTAREQLKPEECSPLNESMCRYMRELEKSLDRLDRQQRADAAKIADLQGANARQGDALQAAGRAAGLRTGDDITVELVPMIERLKAQRDQPVTARYAGSIVGEGIRARDGGDGGAYVGNTIEHYLHSVGWVQRDLRLALDSARKDLGETRQELQVLRERERQLTSLGRAIAADRHRMSYNASYYGEPAGCLKSIATAFDRLCPGEPVKAAAPRQADPVDELCGLPLPGEEQASLDARLDAFLKAVANLVSAGATVQLCVGDKTLGPPISL